MQNGTQTEGMNIKKVCKRVHKERGEIYTKNLSETITWTQSLNERLEMQLKYKGSVLYARKGDKYD